MTLCPYSARNLALERSRAHAVSLSQSLCKVSSALISLGDGPGHRGYIPVSFQSFIQSWILRKRHDHPPALMLGVAGSISCSYGGLRTGGYHNFCFYSFFFDLDSVATLPLPACVYDDQAMMIARTNPQEGTVDKQPRKAVRIWNTAVNKAPDARL